MVPRRALVALSSDSDSDSDSSLDSEELAALGLDSTIKPPQKNATRHNTSQDLTHMSTALEQHVPKSTHTNTGTQASHRSPQEQPSSPDPARNVAVAHDKLALTAACVSPQPEETPVEPALGGALGTAWLDQSESASLPPNEPDDKPSTVGHLQVFEHVGNSGSGAGTSRYRAFYADVSKPTECASVLAVLRENATGTGEFISYAFRLERRKRSADEGKGNHVGTGKLLAELLELVAADNVLVVVLASASVMQANQTKHGLGICSPQVSCARQLLEQRGWSTPFDAGGESTSYATRVMGRA